MESAALSAQTSMDPRFQEISSHQEETLDPRETRDPLVLLATTDLTDSLAFPAHPAPLGPLALAETSLLKWDMLTTPNPAAAKPLPAQWVPWVLVVLLDPLAPLVLRVSLAPLESPESLELLVPWVLVVLLAPLERTEMMVSLANPVAPVSVELLALRELADSPEPLDFLVSRDTEDSVV